MLDAGFLLLPSFEGLLAASKVLFFLPLVFGTAWSLYVAASILRSFLVSSRLLHVQSLHGLGKRRGLGDQSELLQEIHREQVQTTGHHGQLPSHSSLCLGIVGEKVAPSLNIMGQGFGGALCLVPLVESIAGSHERLALIRTQGGSKSEQSSSSSSSTWKPRRKRDRRSPAPAMEALANSPSPEKSPANEIDLALATWHLSEAQSFKQEWDDLGCVEDRQAAELGRINKLLAVVPGNVLKAYQLELVLPMKKKPSKWRQIAERVDVLVAAAIEFWNKQQQAVGPGDS